jgi:hypothetical protein
MQEVINLCYYCIMSDYKKLLKKKKKVYADVKNMGVDIDKNEYFEIKMSQSNHPDKLN